MRDDVDFSFWAWFFEIMALIRQKLQRCWDEGLVRGFISRSMASELVLAQPRPSFLLRFSDSLLGGLSVSFAALLEDGETVFIVCKHEKIFLHTNYLYFTNFAAIFFLTCVFTLIKITTRNLNLSSVLNLILSHDFNGCFNSLSRFYHFKMKFPIYQYNLPLYLIIGDHWLCFFLKL